MAAIVWIGTSFYFVALDSHLRRRATDATREAGIGGESWEIHGGGFYRVSKFQVAPETLPEPLHWFKWEAYTTWLAGFALLVVLYYVDADKYLVDPSVADLGRGRRSRSASACWRAPGSSTTRSVGMLGGHELCSRRPIGFVAASAYARERALQRRAAPIQVGAMLGTMMAGNVLFVIIPGHRELVRAKQAGREPDPAPGLRASSARCTTTT